MCKHFSGKILKKVVEKFFWEMCSDEFFLKHALEDGRRGPSLVTLQFTNRHATNAFSVWTPCTSTANRMSVIFHRHRTLLAVVIVCVNAVACRRSTRPPSRRISRRPPAGK